MITLPSLREMDRCVPMRIYLCLTPADINGVRQFRVSEAPTGVIFRSGDVVAVGGWVSERRWEA